MIDAVMRVFDVPVEHGAVATQADLVSGFVYLEPLISVGFVLTDLIAYFGMKDLGAATGQAAQASISQVLQDLFGALLRQNSNQLNLYRRPGLQLQFGIGSCEAS